MFNDRLLACRVWANTHRRRVRWIWAVCSGEGKGKGREREGAMMNGWAGLGKVGKGRSGWDIETWARLLLSKMIEDGIDKGWLN